MGALGIPMGRVHKRKAKRLHESAGPDGVPLRVRPPRTWTPANESPWTSASNLREVIAAKRPHLVPFGMRVQFPTTELDGSCQVMNTRVWDANFPEPSYLGNQNGEAGDTSHR